MCFQTAKVRILLKYATLMQKGKGKSATIYSVVKVARGLRGRMRRWGWGIWHICIKHIFINSRGLKPKQGLLIITLENLDRFL